MFWSLVLLPNRRYSSTIREAFHLSMATLDIKTVKNDQELFPVLLKIDGKEDSILCNLSKASFPQVPLDLNFEKGTKVGFFTNGSATVHLTGYLIDDEFDESDMSEEGDSSEASFESADEAPVSKGQGDMKSESSKKKKRKSEDALDEVSKKKSKSKSGDEDGSKNGLDMRMKTLNDSKASDSDDDEDDDDDDDDLDDLDLSGSDLGSDGSADLSSDDDADDDDDDEDDDDEDDEDDDDSDDSEKVKPQKTPQQSPKKKPEEKTPKQGKNVQNQTPSSNKKQGKQNISLLNGAVTPKSEKKAKSDTPQQKQGGGNKDTPQKQQGGHKDTPQPKQGGNNKGTPQQQKPGGSPKKQTLAGGVQIEDLKTGNGPVAKPGKMVSVYYTGRLKANNRVFDQNNKGPGFKFRLGQGEVVKGYDIGISGMTVGSKRRITIPPHMAYGKKGQQPQIPPNATLVFEVELKSVN